MTSSCFAQLAVYSPTSEFFRNVLFVVALVFVMDEMIKWVGPKN